jgi:uncharacterized protein YndB with AHSA1/START domain
MSDATLETIGGRPALRFERRLGDPVERVWRAISVPAELRQWFPAAGDWIPETGETFEAFGMSGKVIVADPPHRLAWTFAGDRYSFELTPEGDGCRLVFAHVFDDRATAAQTAAGWDTYLARLEPHLGGGFLSEADAHRGWEELHERYAASFGVDPAPGRQFLAAQRAGR